MVCCCKILSVDMLFFCSCPWMSGCNVPVNFQVKCYYPFCNFFYLYMNGNVKSVYLSSSLFLPHHSKDLEQRLKFKARDKLQLSYSSSRQIFQDMEWGHPNESWWLLVFPFYFLSPSLGCTLFKIGFYSTTNQEKNENWHILEADWQLQVT